MALYPLVGLLFAPDLRETLAIQLQFNDRACSSARYASVARYALKIHGNVLDAVRFPVWMYLFPNF